MEVGGRYLNGWSRPLVRWPLEILARVLLILAAVPISLAVFVSLEVSGRLSDLVIAVLQNDVICTGIALAAVLLALLTAVLWRPQHRLGADIIEGIWLIGAGTMLAMPIGYNLNLGLLSKEPVVCATLSLLLAWVALFIRFALGKNRSMDNAPPATPGAEIGEGQAIVPQPAPSHHVVSSGSPRLVEA